MKFLSINNLFWNICLPLLLLTSCIGEDGICPDPDHGISFDGKVQLAIHIAPVNTITANNTDYFNSEKIKSLRIILVSTDTVSSADTIEFNKYIPVSDGGMPVKDFQYDYVWKTKPGKKKFYILANEESVGNYSLLSSGDNDTPGSAVQPDSNLTKLLDGYLEGTVAGNLVETMNSIYFTPKYESTGNNTFLPYSSVYDNIMIEEKDQQRVSMFLVPVATKFIFNFTNARQFPVVVNGISLTYTNTESFLFGHVGSNDSIKTLDGNPFYWVDWLAQISILSQEYPGYYPNIGFNELYGWISDYDLPSDDKITSVLIAQGESFTIQGTENYDTDDAVPGTGMAGPFYVPESRNFIDPRSPSSEPEDYQMYYLTFNFTDTRDNSPLELADEYLYIDNLNALFRNTFCIINVRLGQGDVDVYAEIADWNQKSIQGWVNEGQARPGLTFP